MAQLEPPPLLSLQVEGLDGCALAAFPWCWWVLPGDRLGTSGAVPASELLKLLNGTNTCLSSTGADCFLVVLHCCDHGCSAGFGPRREQEGQDFAVVCTR